MTITIPKKTWKAFQLILGFLFVITLALLGMAATFFFQLEEQHKLQESGAARLSELEFKNQDLIRQNKELQDKQTELQQTLDKAQSNTAVTPQLVVSAIESIHRVEYAMCGGPCPAPPGG